MSPQHERKNGLEWAVAPLLAALALWAACDGLLWDLPDRVERTSDVSGQWRLEGSGSRSQCRNDLYSCDYRLRLAGPIDVAQTSADGYGVEHLSLASPAESGDSWLIFWGGVQGREVEFTLGEEAQGGLLMELVFSGTWRPSRSTIEGTFSGDGPEDCVNAGRFKVFVQP